MFSVQRWGTVVGCIIALLLLLPGCGNQEQTPDPKVALGNLAEEYWSKRLMDLDYESTYDMELQKDALSFSEYQQKVKSAGQIKVLSVKADEVEIENGRGVVNLTTTCRIQSVPKEMELPIRDVWIKKAKEWKHQLPEK